MGDGRVQSGDGRDVPLASGRPVRSVGAGGDVAPRGAISDDRRMTVTEAR